MEALSCQFGGSPSVAGGQPVELVGADAARRLPLSELPQAIRRMADERARLSREWATAFGHFNERRRSLTLYFHRDEGLGITAAEMQAEIDPHVIDAGEQSRRLKERIIAFENAQRQLEQEFQVKLLAGRADHGNSVTVT